MEREGNRILIRLDKELDIDMKSIIPEIQLRHPSFENYTLNMYVRNALRIANKIFAKGGMDLIDRYLREELPE